MNDERKTLFLICRVRSCLYALPLEYVVETMRPLPLEPLAESPDFVSGIAIIRGALMPVVDVACLIHAESSQSTRFVTVKIQDHHLALCVDEVLGVRTIPVSSLQTLPSLLQDARAEVISSVGILDANLLVVLRNTHLVPDTVWGSIEKSHYDPR